MLQVKPEEVEDLAVEDGAPFQARKMEGCAVPRTCGVKKEWELTGSVIDFVDDVTCIYYLESDTAKFAQKKVKFLNALSEFVISGGWQ
jgi:hypothetical protein